MIGTLVLVLCALNYLTVAAMESESPAPFEISLMRKPLYIGDDQTRNGLIEAYGQNFPYNTVFIPVQFQKNPENGTDSGNLIEKLPKPAPRYIPYHLISNAKEGGKTELKLYKKVIRIQFKQMRQEYWYNEKSFEQAAADLLEDFKIYPNCLIKGEKKLIQEKVLELVLDRNRYTAYKHGPNASPLIANNN